MVVRDVRTNGVSVRQMLRPLVEHLKTETVPLVVKWVPSLDRPISHYLSTETQWQRRLQHCRLTQVSCSCRALVETLGAWADCVKNSVGRAEQHFLVRWADLMQPRREPPTLAQPACCSAGNGPYGDSSSHLENTGELFDWQCY